MRGVVNRRDRLIDVIACIAHFAMDDFYNGDVNPPPPQFEDMVQAAYIVACFVAQNTPKGEEGVDTEYAMTRMQMTHRMPYEDRRELASRFIHEFWPKGEPQARRTSPTRDALMVKLEEAYQMAKALPLPEAAKPVSAEPTEERHRELAYAEWRKLIYEQHGSCIFAPQPLENGHTRHFAIQNKRVVGKYDTENRISTVLVYPKEKS